MLLANWQDSVVSICTPTAHGSGFEIDWRGLIATSQRAWLTMSSDLYRALTVRRCR